MKKLIGVLFLIFALSGFIQPSMAQKVISYKLDNGLTVILNQDMEQPTVFGAVVVKTGSKNDPAEATGISHYLEHMMFKGTQELGTTNWESEKPHYEAMIDLFEQLRTTTDEVQKTAIYAKINEEARQSGQFAIPNEFSNLVQAIGGVNLNASTSYDQTQYFCMFPSFELRKWAELYSHLFQHPVFRGFQTEVEAVFEEKNMYADNPASNMNEAVMKEIFGEHPYGRPIIGTTDHLKNPSLKLMIDYYKKWYVPSNMAVVLSGKFDMEETKDIINQSFGQWKSGTTPTSSYSPLIPVKGKKTVTLKMLPYKMGVWAFNGVEEDSKDKMALELLGEILNNSSKTGLLDKLQIDGDVNYVSAGPESLIDGGRFLIQAVPMFDRSQLRQISVGETESILFKELDKVKAGEFDEWLLESVKNQTLRDYELAFESPSNTATYLMSLFVQNRPVEDIYKIKEEITKVDKAQIVALANKYLNNDCITFQCLEGSDNPERVKKPNFAVIDLPKNAVSEYKKKFMTIPSSKVEEKYIDFASEVSQKTFAPGVELYYKNNQRNDIFTMTIRYGAGTILFPTLDYAVSLMNRAGVMGQYSPKEYKQEMSKIGCKMNISCDGSYTFIEISGNESNLGSACLLLSKLSLLPKLDIKQLDAIVGNDIMTRKIAKTDKDMQKDALQQYLFYGTESDYIKRLTPEDVSALTIKGLTGDYIRATQYEAEVHYSGKMPEEKVFSVLKENLAFPDGLKKSDAPLQKKLASYPQTTIFFLNNSEAKQSSIFFYMDGGAYSVENEAKAKAFNQYFDGGFNGLVLQEIREYRAMAYTAAGKWINPPKMGLNKFFYGYIGTQADKTVDAVTTYASLIKDMPQKPERLDNIKTYLINSSLTFKPSPRDISLSIEGWEKLGYTTDPAYVLIPKYRVLTFDDILQFYNENMKSKPYAIAIMGDKKVIDLKKLETIGKVVQLSTSTIIK